MSYAAGLGLLTLLSAASGLLLLRRLAGVAAGYCAKLVASGVLVAGRDPASLSAQELAGAGTSWALRLVSVTIEPEQGRVVARVPGLARRCAALMPETGCALGLETAGGRCPTPPEPLDLPRRSRRSRALEAVLEEAFDEPQGGQWRRTRAVLVLRRGEVLAERYAEGFGPDSRQAGWSMTKSVTAALAGLRLGEGGLDLDSAGLLPQWRNDGRAAITLDHLLQMRSGLQFDEDYRSPFSDVVRMLFEARDCAGYAAAKPLRDAPGNRFHYASGSTNIVSLLLRRSFAADAEYWAFPRRALFEPLGMHSAVMEADAAGTFVGSSYLYATAGDWARFGEMLRLGGVWNGRRLLPEGWVEYCTRAQPDQPRYGAHFWLQVPRYYQASEFPVALPPAYHAIGHEGQFVSVLPEAELVVVRLGLTRRRGAWDHPAFLARVLDAV